MPYYDFIWTDEIIEHIAQHDITADDFQEVVCHAVIRGTSHSSGRLAAWGETSDGRIMIAIYESLDDITIIPVTAYEVPDWPR